MSGSVQVSQDVTNIPVVLFGDAFHEIAILEQDSGRGTTALENYTVMAKVVASQKWVPYTDEAATDGSAIPLGILVSGEVTGAALVAGDVASVSIIVGGNVTVDAALLVFENSTALDDIFATGTIYATSVKDQLANIGIFTEATVAVSAAENS